MTANKLVYGAGVNDAGYQVYRTSTIDGRRKIMWQCPMYLAWKNMLARCYSTKCHAKYPTYIGCTVAPEWHSFSVFRAWMITQPWEGSELDKDILAPGNKIYSPETCVFVSSQLNMFINDNGAVRGRWPIGVSRQEVGGKLRARCKNPATRKLDHLGMFTDPNEAHEAWRAKKHQHACRYADMQTDQRIAQALRERYA